MVQFNPDLLNSKVAPEIADFRSAEIPDLRASFPQNTYWLANQFLNFYLVPDLKGNWKQWNINMLFRAHMQFRYYHDALDFTNEFFKRSRYHNPAVSSYYQAVSMWENSFLNLQIFIDLFRKSTGEPSFTKNDGSAEQRAYDIANTVKHWASDISSNRHDREHMLPMWLNSKGFNTLNTHLSFLDYAEITRDIAITADAYEKVP